MDRSPASRACGKGSRRALENAGNSTLGRVASLIFEAIFPKQIVVLVRIAGSGSVYKKIILMSGSTVFHGEYTITNLQLGEILHDTRVEIAIRQLVRNMQH